MMRNPSNRNPAFLISQITVTTIACFMAACLIRSIVHPLPVLAAGLIFSRASCSLGLLVSMVGAVVVRYSIRYLDGDPKQKAFMGFLILSVVSALCLMLADHLLLLVLGWSLTSFGLHFLLTHYRANPDAIAAARKKFLISRLGDIALLAALFTIQRSVGTLSLTVLFSKISTSHDVPVLAVWLICLAAISKSAQFPFHTWLPDTLAAPTPVSALMHAGIINGGGALLLKFAPLLVKVPGAGLFLAVVGSLTMTIGMISMWSQSTIKRKLAWSTVGQMGFMTAEFGIFAFGAALIHILAHGFYKAHAFLEASAVEPVAPEPIPISPGRKIGLIVVGIIATQPIQWVVHQGALSATQSAVFAMTGLGVGHVWVAVSANSYVKKADAWKRWGLLILVSQLLSLISATLLRVVTEACDLPVAEPSVLGSMAAAVPVLTLIGLTVASVYQLALRQTRIGHVLHIHAQNGFYIGQLADRLVSQVWAPSSEKAI